MNSFRKKPLIIEAFQMTEARRTDNSEWPTWLSQAWQKSAREEGALMIDQGDPARQRLVIFTREGVMRVDWDDWIVQGVKKELYVCKPDIFAAIYEPVESA